MLGNNRLIKRAITATVRKCITSNSRGRDYHLRAARASRTRPASVPSTPSDSTPPRRSPCSSDSSFGESTALQTGCHHHHHHHRHYRRRHRRCHRHRGRRRHIITIIVMIVAVISILASASSIVIKFSVSTNVVIRTICRKRTLYRS